jgi:dienelactone hydrolase
MSLNPAPPLRAEPLRALPAGQLPADERLRPPKDLDGYFPFSPPTSRTQWEARAAELRRQVLVSLGLWPLPSKAPLNAVVHGRVDRDDYTVERAFFESMPGFYVTGSLYRPKEKVGKLPGVLCPHGHWEDGRFHDAGTDKVKKEIASGAEQFEEGGRSPLQARCVQLARMGCVVFHYDMIGYADSTQISFEVAHRFAEQRPEMNADQDWGLFSPQAESHLQSVMGLQTFNSIRALDFLTSLPDVDANRIGVTGASGGGTQTFILAAVDPRPAVIFPAVMVSTAMQGGCTCENACGLRIDTGNVEITGLFAPKPVAMSAANDWTKEMETKGYPQLQELYRLLDAPDHVLLMAALQFDHNYNHVSRSAMYHWFNRHLGLGLAEPIAERDYHRLSREEMTVWGGTHPQPAGGPDFERQLLRWWTQDSSQQLASQLPKDAATLEAYREAVGGAWHAVLQIDPPASEDLIFSESARRHGDGFDAIAGLLRNARAHHELPVLVLQPTSSKPWTVVWLHPQGKAGLLEADGSPKSEVRRLLAAGASVLGVDLLHQGEFLADGKPLEKTPRVANKREAAAYTYGYNRTVFAQRAQDVLTVLAHVAHRGGESQRVDLVGLEGAGLWAATARSQTHDVIRRAAIDTQGFRFGTVPDIRHPDFLPGGAKYGDTPGLVSVAKPAPLWLAGETEPAVVVAAYRAAGALDQLHLSEEAADQRVAAAVSWLLAE